jgi:hypothetical protein
MKALIFSVAILITISANAGLGDDAALARLPGPLGDAARERLAHPIMPTETPDQYRARRMNEKLMEQIQQASPENKMILIQLQQARQQIQLLQEIIDELKNQRR